MTTLQDFHVETHGGICDLGRVVSVLALLDVTPLELKVQRGEIGLKIDLRIDESLRTSTLCVARLQALVSVSAATLRPAGAAA